MPDFDSADCMFLASKFERWVRPSTRVRIAEHEVEGDCVIDLLPSNVTKGGALLLGHGARLGGASLQFSRFPTGPGLVASDIAVFHSQTPKIRKLLKTLAKSCDVEDVHPHAKELGRDDFHLTDCSMPDLKRVLQEAGY